MAIKCIRCGRVLKNPRKSGMGYTCERKTRIEKQSYVKKLWDYENDV